MPMQVDFYVLKSSDELTRMRTVCRLADKVQRLGHHIFVLTEDHDQSKKLDDLMWTFSQSSFLPHAVFNDSGDYMGEQPVLIHHQAIEKESEVLINLQQCPPETGQFKRLVEIINQEESVRRNGRDKYRTYKDQNYQIKIHNLAA